MSALDRMMGKAGPAAEPGTRAPSMMESAMLKMLEGVGLDAGALAKVQQDVSAFALFVKEKLEKAEADNAKILENQAGILAALAELNDHAPSVDDNGT